MSGTGGASVDVIIEGGRTTFAAGETVRGALVVRCPGPRRCDHARVRLWWAAYGRQDETDHTETVDEVVCATHAELSGEHRWSFALRLPPSGPATFDGETVWTVYNVTGRVQWSDGDEPTLQKVGLTVEPMALPPAAGDADETALPVWRCGDLAAIRARVGDAAAAVAAVTQASNRARRRRLRDGLGDVRDWGLVALIGTLCAGTALAMLFGLAAWILEPGVVLRKVVSGLLLALLVWRLWAPAGALLRTWRARLYYGGVDLDILDPPRFAAVGETPEFRVRVRRRTRRPVERMAWELRVRQRAARIVKRAGREDTDTSTEWDETVRSITGADLAPPPAPDAAVTVRGTIPRGAPTSLDIHTRRLVWEFRVWVYSRGDSFTEGHELQVLPLRRRAPDEPPAAASTGTPPETSTRTPTETSTETSTERPTGTPTGGPTGTAPADTPPLAPAPAPPARAAASPTAIAPAAADPPEVRRRRAAFAVSRLRNARRGELRSWLDQLLVVAFALYPGSLALLILSLPDGVKLPAVLSLPLILTASVGVIVLALLAPVFGVRALYHVGKAALLAPWRGLRLFWEKRAERLLLRNGVVPRAWFAGRRVRRAAIDRLVALEPDIVLAEEGLRPLSVGPPDGCPSCGAALGSPGPGLRRCAHCEFERYDPPPARSSALSAADAALRSLVGPPVADRAALFRAFRRQRSPRLGTGLAWSLGGVALMFAGALVTDLLGGPGAGNDTANAFLALGMLGGLSGAGGLAWISYRWLRLRFVEFRPGVLVHDLALRDEVLRVVAHQGQIGLGDLSEHLGLPRARTDALIGRMAASRHLPLYHDREGDRLVSAFVQAVGTSRCPACGGRLEVAAGTKLTCLYCETEVKAA
jgi:hypothetical protein